MVATLLGTVDRVRRCVDWSIECPECSHEIPIVHDQFVGEEATSCAECGWKVPRESNDPPRWYDFSAVAFDRSVPPREKVQA